MIVRLTPAVVVNPARLFENRENPALQKADTEWKMLMKSLLDDTACRKKRKSNKVPTASKLRVTTTILRMMPIVSVAEESR